MKPGSLNLTETFAALPAEWLDDLLPAIRAKVQASGRKLVVLDDDPTGTQTVYDLPVLTEWPVERLKDELCGPEQAFYLLTNSRSLPLNDARAINAEIGANLTTAARECGRDFTVVSRSDSTLRGHFPGEVQALADALGDGFDAWIVLPFFAEGGRFTLNDVHYVAESGRLTPAGETEFARDKTFGFRASNLKEWVAEKSGGAVPAGAVESISLDLLRREGPQAVTAKLLDLPRGSVCVVNAVSYRDLEVFVRGLLDAEAAGKHYLYRTAASFVRVRAGLAPRPLLTGADLDLPPGGAGLVVAGSYVPRTSAQLDALIYHGSVYPLEVQVEHLLDESQRAAEIERVAIEANHLLQMGRNVVVYTSRKLVSVEQAEANLGIGRIVSDSLVAIVRGISVRPRYLLAKGGITSSDIATRGLEIRRAMVLGQILPGVPVWQSGPESRYPGMPYIVFPGNVGGAGALAEIVDNLS